MRNKDTTFNIAKFHHTGVLANTHAPQPIKSENIIGQHLKNSDVDRKLTSLLENKQWGISHSPAQQPGPQGPSSNKRSPS